MHIQLNCPFCQQLMTADSRLAGNQVQCPTCQQYFMIAANVAPVLPVAQARVASSPPSSPQAANRKPAAGPPQGSRKPVGPARPVQSSSAAAKAAAEKEEAKAKMAMVAVLLGGVGLIVAGIWFVSSMAQKAEQSASALPPEVIKREKAEKEKREKEKRAAEILETKNKEKLRDLIRVYVAKGDDKIAGELLAILDKIEAEHDALMQDADSNNDPSDYRAFGTERLKKHIAENPMVRNWLGGKSTDTIATLLFGPEPAKEQGKLPMFLVTGGYTGNGTGFCISSDGWLVTNHHVVSDATTVDARGADGRIVAARVVKTDANADLALLKLPEKPTAWLHLDPTAMQRGARVFTVGFPNATVQGVEPKFTDGRISSTAGIRDDAETYQTSVPVGPGNSGGPLVNLQDGTVAGVISSKLNAQLSADSVSYAIKSSALESMLKSVSETNGAGSGEASSHPSSEQAIIDHVTQATYLILVK